MSQSVPENSLTVKYGISVTFVNGTDAGRAGLTRCLSNAYKKSPMV
jgi:hypothetical protein